MVKWVKVNNEEEHRKLIEVWGKNNVDSIETHKEWKRYYPYWFADNNNRQGDDGYIERNYSDEIVSFQEVINSSQNINQIVLW